MSGEGIRIPCQRVRALFSGELLQYLSDIAERQPRGIFLAGGTVRDLMLGREPADVDLTVACHAKAWAGELARMTGGAYVALGRDEDAARVVWQGETIDFSIGPIFDFHSVCCYICAGLQAILPLWLPLRYVAIAGCHKKSV